MNALAIGVDAGGTATVAAAAVDGIYERSVRGGPANASSLGTAAASAAIAATVRELAGTRTVEALFVAAAGCGRDESRDALLAALREAFPQIARVAVEDDTRVALRAGIDEGPGVVVIAGTGSVAYAEADGRRIRVGGAGYLLGDEGSAFAIGMAGLRLLARHYDGRARADETLALVARTFDVTDRESLLARTYGVPLDVARVASLAPAIVAFAGKGNRASTKIVQSAAQELGDLVRAAVAQAELGERSPSIVFAGGLLRENTLLSYLLETRVTNETPGALVVRSRDEPARAALAFASELGTSPGDRFTRER
ncbi:MAG: BadF/BadG/BcrA/BcrD ATPase family protein [Vulcanimicrobiaceae bacterium]